MKELPMFSEGMNIHPTEQQPNDKTHITLFSEQTQSPIVPKTPSVLLPTFLEPSIIDQIPEPSLTKNRTLEAISTRITQSASRWNQLLYASLPDSSTHNESGEIGVIRGLLAEQHLYNELVSISEESQGEFVIDPIPDGTKTDSYEFIMGENAGQYIARDRKTNQDVVEYDSITQVEGLFVVWEVKQNDNGLYPALHVNRQEKLFAPLQEYSESKSFGYVIAIANEKSSLPRKEQLRIKAFQRKGGILTSFTGKS